MDLVEEISRDGLTRKQKEYVNRSCMAVVVVIRITLIQKKSAN